MDALVITAIATALSGLAVAVFTHIKHSRCCGVDLETRDTQPPQFIERQPSPLQTPTLVHKSTDV
jgi:hypothetical protein